MEIAYSAGENDFALRARGIRSAIPTGTFNLPASSSLRKSKERRRVACQRSSGFTLVELIVVIAIIALLVGILLPALAAARDAAQSVVCMSNLRQMGIGMSVYAVDHDNFFPPTRYISTDGTLYMWDFTHIPDGTIRPGLVWMGSGAKKVQQCPGFKRTTDPYTHERYSGYNYNTSYLGAAPLYPPFGGQPYGPPPLSDQTQLYQVQSPSMCVAFGDGGYAAGATKYMRAPWGGQPHEHDASYTGSLRGAGTQAFRHQGLSNAAFVDGHVESFKTAYHNTNPAAKAFIGENPRFGYLSKDNSLYDLK